MAAKSVEVTEEEEEVVIVEDAGVVVFFLVGFKGTEEVVGLCFGIDLDFLVAFFLGTGFGLVGFADLSDSFAFLLLRVSICFSRARVCVSLKVEKWKQIKYQCQEKVNNLPGYQLPGQELVASMFTIK